MIEAEQLHARILARLDMTRDMEDEELTELIYEVLQEVSQEEYLPLDQKTMLGKELFNAFRKLDLLQEFLEQIQSAEGGESVDIGCPASREKEYDQWNTKYFY